MLSLLAKAAIYRPPSLNSNSSVSLPKTVLTKEHQINPQHCNRFNELCKWSAGIASVIHPNYVQVLSLPLQLQLMVNAPFPFKAFGLVHLRNAISVTRLPEQQANISLKVFFGNVFWHKRGWVFEVITNATVDNQTAVCATSYYLARVKHAAKQNITSYPSYQDIIQANSVQTDQRMLDDSHHMIQQLSFSKQIGRQYASVSGDYNPIHLSQYSAKLLGFKKAIAHGMFSKALCVSAMMKPALAKNTALLNSFDVDADFVMPIYLPSAASLTAFNAIESDDSNAIEYCLSNQHNGKQRVYLSGVINYHLPF